LCAAIFLRGASENYKTQNDFDTSAFVAIECAPKFMTAQKNNKTGTRQRGRVTPESVIRQAGGFPRVSEQVFAEGSSVEN